jgi:probable F420-dependent oxidoreductase
MRTGLLLPAATQGSGSDLTAFAQRAEQLGYDSLWLPEIAEREVIAAAGWLLASTSRLRVGTAIASVYARDASTAAMAAHTLAEFSNGRFALGLGVSIPWLVEQRGQVWEKPLGKADSYLDAYAAMEVLSPAPAQPAPVYFAAHGPRIIETVKDRVDGLITINVPPAHTADVRARLRDDQDLVVIKTILPETDAETARALARKAVAVYLDAAQYWSLWPTYGFDESDRVPGGSDRLIDMLVAWGDTDNIARQVAEYFDAGATDVILRVPTDGGDAVEWPILEELAPTS